MDGWPANINELNRLLNELSVRNGAGHELNKDSGFVQWRDRTLQIRSEKMAVYFVGNGASAAMASHFSADLSKNAHIRTQVFTDLSLITACANDVCYKEVYALPLSWSMKKGDMLIAISSSGNSPNIVQAIEMAKYLGGMVVTLSAMGEDNVIRGIGDLNFYIPAKTYGMAETCHAAILHFWMDLVEEKNMVV